MRNFLEYVGGTLITVSMSENSGYGYFNVEDRRNHMTMSSKSQQAGRPLVHPWSVVASGYCGEYGALWYSDQTL